LIHFYRPERRLNKFTFLRRVWVSGIFVNFSKKKKKMRKEKRMRIPEQFTVCLFFSLSFEGNLIAPFRCGMSTERNWKKISHNFNFKWSEKIFLHLQIAFLIVLQILRHLAFRNEYFKLFFLYQKSNAAVEIRGSSQVSLNAKYKMNFSFLAIYIHLKVNIYPCDILLTLCPKVNCFSLSLSLIVLSTTTFWPSQFIDEFFFS
jgi:hypothetical protein